MHNPQWTFWKKSDNLTRGVYNENQNKKGRFLYERADTQPFRRDGGGRTGRAVGAKARRPLLRHPYLRRDPEQPVRSRPGRQAGGRGAGLRHLGGVHDAGRLLGRGGGPVCQPHRQGPLFLERQGVRAGGEQRPEPPSRRPQGLFLPGVDGGGADRGQGRPDAGQPRRGGGLPRPPDRPGDLHPDGGGTDPPLRGGDGR